MSVKVVRCGCVLVWGVRCGVVWVVIEAGILYFLV